jgi:YD repeat-containing protein
LYSNQCPKKGTKENGKTKGVGSKKKRTAYVYGAFTEGGSDINSTDILFATQYPDKTTGNPSASEQESYTTNALGETKTLTDRAGNVHTLAYDILGRVTSDAVTTLAAGFALQPRYSLIHREIEEEILPFAARENIGVIVYSPMA